MKAEDLLFKMNRLDCIYGLIDAEIEAYGISISNNVFEIWQKRKIKIQLNLINQFKKETLIDAIKHCKQYPQLMLNNPVEIILRHI